MKFRTKTAYALLFSTMLGMGVATVSQVTTAHAAPDTCETTGLCLTERPKLDKETVKKLNAYPSMTKNRLAYYKNQGISGPFIFHNGTDLFGSSPSDVSIQYYYLPEIDISNYMKKSDIDKPFEIELTLKNAAFADVIYPDEKLEDKGPEENIVSLSQVLPAKKSDEFASHNKTYSYAINSDNNFLDLKEVPTPDYYPYAEATKLNLKGNLPTYEKGDEGPKDSKVVSPNVTLSFQSLKLIAKTPHEINLDEIKDITDFKNENNWVMNMKLIVDGEERFNGPIYEGYTGYVDEDELSEEDSHKLSELRGKFNYLLSSKEMKNNFPKSMSSDWEKSMLDSVYIFEYVKPKEIKEIKDNQPVKANVLNGGITGGIVSTEVGKNLTIEDVDFGKLSIGQPIESVKKDSMVSVRDWTGGNGWKLTAQHKEADRNQSLQLGVQVNEGTQVDLNDDAQPVTSGESQLEVTTQGGEYTAKWGTHPTVGEFNNVIEWNLSANVSE